MPANLALAYNIRKEEKGRRVNFVVSVQVTAVVQDTASARCVGAESQQVVQ
jgi:hypothetical protein